uniref:Uncharacterized protein n=1 Tax=Amphimedon queenslandica TaxID=400682 RepID=A0A1X7UKC4_AMPQE
MINTFDVSSLLHFNRTVFQNTVLYQPQTESSIVNIYFNNSVFTNNTATTVGSCIHAINTETFNRVLNIHLNNITAYNNFRTENHFGSTRTEIVKVDYAQLYISGLSNFSYNFGTVFGISNSIISLNGQLNIIGNNGYMGTGFKVQGSSYFLLSNGLNATFINNTALTLGGAIYAVADDANRCMFQSNTNNITNIKMTFIDNTASEAGSSIYSNKIHGCETYISGRHRNISIPPTSLCLCGLSCNAATNEYNLSAFIRPDRDNVHSVPSWQVSANSANQALFEKQDCTSVTITLLKNKNEPNPSSPAIIVSSSCIASGLTFYGIQLLDCPIGFELNVTEGKCVCSRILDKLYSTSYRPDCHISSGADNSISTITRTGTEWIGLGYLSNGIVVFGAALNCIVYCWYKSGYTELIVNDTSVAIADSDDLSNSVPLCIDNREGLSCSQCPPGYSVVYGSYECKQYSNWWLFTLIIYAVIGPLLIYLLYVLKLTLTTGNLNGIIFCVQLLGFIDPPSIDKKGMSILLNGWANYDLSFSLCLYSEMTELWRYGLVTYSTGNNCTQ